MSIAGQSFCSSAYNGMLLNFKHGIKFTFGNYLAFLFILVGKLGITVLNVFLTWLFMKHVTGSASEVSTIYGPLAFVGLLSYLTVCVFLGIYDVSVLAMLTSTCADMDINGGYPRWGPATLHETLGGFEEKRNKTSLDHMVQVTPQTGSATTGANMMV